MDIWSGRVRSWSAEPGPSPATVYALPFLTWTVELMTGVAEAAAPAARMATVYWPVATDSYGEASPYDTFRRTIAALAPPNG